MTNRLTTFENVGTADSAPLAFVTRFFGGVFIDADGDGDFIFAGGRGGMMFFRNVTGEPPGVYWIRLETKQVEDVEKMVVVK